MKQPNVNYCEGYLNPLMQAFCLQGSGVEKAVSAFLSIFDLARDLSVLIYMFCYLGYVCRNALWLLVFPALLLFIDVISLGVRAGEQSDLYKVFLDEESEWMSTVCESVELRSTITTYRSGLSLASILASVLCLWVVLNGLGGKVVADFADIHEVRTSISNTP